MSHSNGTNGTTPEISLVVASYQRAQPLNLLLGRLANQTLSKDLWEVIVAVDGSTDDSMAILEKWDAKKILPLNYFYQSNQGQSVARHHAIEKARAPRVIVIDDDMDPSMTFLEGHLKAGASDPERIITIGRVIPQDNWRSMPLYETVREASMVDLHTRLDQGAVPSATSFITQNVAFPRAMYNAVGGFDPSLRLDEDRELGMRLERAGGIFVFAREAAAIHRSAVGSYGKWKTRQYDYGHFGVQVWRKHAEDPLLHPLRNFIAGSRWNRLLVQVAAPSSFVGEMVTRLLRATGNLFHSVGFLKGGIATHKAIIALQYHLGVKDAFGGWSSLKREEALLLANPNRPVEPTARGKTFQKVE